MFYGLRYSAKCVRVPPRAKDYRVDEHECSAPVVWENSSISFATRVKCRLLSRRSHPAAGPGETSRGLRTERPESIIDRRFATFFHLRTRRPLATVSRRYPRGYRSVRGRPTTSWWGGGGVVVNVFTSAYSTGWKCRRVQAYLLFF